MEIICSHYYESRLLLKFGQNQHLKSFLKNTGMKQLAESSPHNNYWGTGIHMKDAACFDRDKWGNNILGTLLMEVREELKVSP